MTHVLVVVATLVAKPGHEAAVQAALEQVVPHSRAEAGCSRYELHADNEHAGHFVMLEEWRDAEALRLHESTPHFQDLVKAIGTIADVQISRLTRIA